MYSMIVYMKFKIKETIISNKRELVKDAYQLQDGVIATGEEK